MIPSITTRGDPLRAYPVDQEVLQSIHGKLIQKTELESQISRGPRRVQACAAAEKQAADERDAAKQELQRMRMAAHDKQVQLKQREGKIEELKAKRNACNSNREYGLLSDQIAADIQANSVLQDEILELLEAIDKQELKLKQLDQNVLAAQRETEKVSASVESRLESLQSDLDAVVVELKEWEAKLSGEIVPEYRRRVAAKQDEALAPVEDNSCGNCFQVLSPQLINEISMARSYICSACDAILYQPESCTSKVGGGAE